MQPPVGGALCYFFKLYDICLPSRKSRRSAGYSPECKGLPNPVRGRGNKCFFIDVKGEPLWLNDDDFSDDDESFTWWHAS